MLSKEYTIGVLLYIDTAGAGTWKSLLLLSTKNSLPTVSVAWKFLYNSWFPFMYSICILISDTFLFFILLTKFGLQRLRQEEQTEPSAVLAFVNALTLPPQTIQLSLLNNPINKFLSKAILTLSLSYRAERKVG